MTLSALSRQVAVPLLCAVGIGCGGAPAADPAIGEPAEAPPEQAAPALEVQLPSRGEFVDEGLALEAANRAEFRATLGEPDSTGVEVLPNRHVPGVLDTIYTIHYPDLVARLHHPGGGGDLLSMVQVSSNRHLRYPVIGGSLTTIDQAFGRPDEASDSSVTYYCTSCVAGDDPVQLVLEDGEVQRVRFNYYVD